MRKRIASYFCRELVAELAATKKRLEVFETQKATLLMAAIDASERVALVVSQHGDKALKTYVDDCFNALISTHGAN